MDQKEVVIVAVFIEKSYAKVNLYLHVLSKRDDGYHELESLVYFPENYFDEIEVKPAKKNKLIVEGAYAPALIAAGADKFEDNIMAKAIAAFDMFAGTETPPLRIKLTKNLFVAGGIGGGSGNAAAILRILNKMHDTHFPNSKLARMAVNIGADVPVCIHQQTAIFRGVGDKIEFLKDFPQLDIVLTNPGVAVNTAEVFKLGFSHFSKSVDLDEYDLTSPKSVSQLLSDTGNDLQANALRLRPEIAFLLEEMAESDIYRFVGMSGSGGTCYGIK